MFNKWDRKRLYISCNYSYYTISFWVTILLGKLKNFYIQYAWILIMKKQNKVEKIFGKDLMGINKI